jgi:hypothetical protein
VTRPWVAALASKKESHAAAVVDSGALVPLRALLDTFDVEVKESAVKSMTAIAGSNHSIMEAGP